MRLFNAVLSDIKFQYKHGFYLVYVIISIMYLIILSFLPQNIIDVAVPLVVFSDPSVLGLFFIGGIILMEKGQGVLMVIVVSPLRTIEYVLAKVISLSLVSILAAFAISYFSYYPNVNWVLLFVSTFLTSSIFTLFGIIINAGCNTVNEYMLKTIPYMLVFILPCFALIGFPYSEVFTVFPSVAALKLMLGVFYGISWFEASFLIVYLLIINYIFMKKAVQVFEKRIVYQD